MVSDPAGFEFQERRRSVYSELKNAGRVVHAMPLLAFEVEGLPMGHRQFGSRRSSCVAVATTVPTSSCAVDFDELSLKVVSERLQDLHKQCLERICSGNCKLFLLELCCGADSSLGACVPESCNVLRISEEINILAEDTQGFIFNITSVVRQHGVMIHAWVSIPCTAGCRWRSVRLSRGNTTGDMPKTLDMINVVIKIILQVVAALGTFTWDWPSTSQLWNLQVIQNFINEFGDTNETKVISHAVVGGELLLKGRSRCVKKAFRIWTTSDGLKHSLQGLAIHVSRNGLEFVECGGALTK